MAEEIIITKAEYIASAVRRDQWPEKKLPEIAFMGRSNVGKSSLINSLAKVHNLARVSGQPGKTRTINYFELSLKNGETHQAFYLVDLPGYGYAKAGRKMRSSWEKFIEEYLLTSPNLLFACQLIDSRHDLMAADEKMFRWLVENGVPVLPIATKIDKQSKSNVKQKIAKLEAALAVPGLEILPYSSVTVAGRSELLTTIYEGLQDATAKE